ncbi:MAG: DUF5928 domain-containing protein [Pseudomonadota bacterium]
MAQIAYILLCHKDPSAVIEQARRLSRAGDGVAIHFDAKAPKEAFQAIKGAVSSLPNVVLSKRRMRCGWGEWSLVAATLSATETALEAFPEATHLFLLSGDCMPIKPAEYAHAYLDEHDMDFIECEDFFESDWIQTGLTEDRLAYRHFFNERSRPRLFYRSLELQKRLGLARAVPKDLAMRIGSQWWCLRRNTMERILSFTKERPDILRFFRTTWIPDETFFQTLVPHLVPSEQIRSRGLTFHLFSDYGKPVTFYNDHYGLLITQDALFARKISPEANELRQRLGRLYATKDVQIRVSDEGKRLYTFLANRGRSGQRYGPRFWEVESTLGREQELMVVACKKWHVGKRLLRALATHSNVPAVEYVFDEEAVPLPDLGGLQDSLEKRSRHRRAMLRMLFDHYETDRLVICIDPASLDLLRDFYADRSMTRLLEVECVYTDDFLKGHARRVGLAGPDTPEGTLQALLPALRNDLLSEGDRLRDAGFPEYYRIREHAAPEENIEPLARFFSIPNDRAEAIARNHEIFID